MLFVVAILSGFILMRSAVSAFYPGTPASFAQFVRAVSLGVVRGGC